MVERTGTQGLLSGTEYRLLVEHAPVMVWRAGLDAKCDYFNETWLAFTGRTAEQEHGDGWAEGVHPEDLERCVAYYLGHFQRREAFEMEYRLRRHDGEYRWILDRGTPFTDDAGAFAGFIGSCVDVHDARLAQEAQRRHDAERLALAHDFERWILAIVSQDMREPLEAIQMAGAALQSGTGLGSNAYRQAQSVHRGVKRIQHILGDLLDLARERDGSGLALDRRASDLRALCQQVVDELAATGADRRVSFDCDTDGLGAWDPQRLLQAISSLATNAIQHGTPGAPVRVRLTGDSEQVTVEVHNRGSIPAEALPYLFEPFRGGRLEAARGQGLGLGLVVVKAIARAHGGDLEVQSGDDATAFRLVLPRYPVATSAAAA